MKKLRILKILLPVLVGIILLGLVLVNLGINNKHVHQLDGQRKNTIRYVLVNEDLGTKFNGKNLNLGKNFVNSINQDNSHSWEVAPLNIAESGFSDGLYDVEIILPQNFSQRLLNLQSMNPQKAQITYKVRKGSSERTNKIVPAKVGTVLNDFNQKVIKMYFSSILANLSEAQRNVNGIVNGEQESQKSLSERVQTPIKSLPGSFTEVISLADELKSQNKGQQDQQDDVIKEIQERLVATNKDVLGNTDQLNNYVTMQKEIGELNQKNANSILAKQSDDDTKAYKMFFDDYNTARKTNFETLGGTQSDASLTAEMAQVGQAFSDEQQKRMADIKSQVASLEQQKVTLQAQLKETEKNYFDQKTPEEATDADVTTSVKTMLAGTSDQAELPTGYLDNIKLDKQKITSDLPALITALDQQKLISDEQANRLLTQFKLVDRYAKNDLQSPLTTGNFKMINVKDDKEPGKMTGTITNTFSLSTQDENLITLQPANTNQKLTITNLSVIAQRINQELKNEHGFATVQGGGIKIVFKNPRVDAVVDHNSQPEAVPLSIDADVEWDFNEEDQADAYRTLDYQWHYQKGQVASIVESDGTLSCFVNMYKTGEALKEDMAQITDSFNTLGKLSQQLVLIFGSTEDQTLTTDAMVQWLAHQPVDAKLATLANKDSIYHKYGYLDQETIASYLITAYKKQGTTIWQSTTDQINKIDEVLNTEDQTSLNGVLAVLETTPTLLTDQKDKVQKWYQTTTAALNEAYQKWQDNPKMTVKQSQYSDSQDDDTLYYDQNGGTDLLGQFKTLSASAKEQADGTKKDTDKVLNLTDQFQDLTKTTKSTKETTNKVIKDTDNLVGTMSTKTNSNQKYATKFNQVLQNTHTGGADNQNVFNFLAQPLTQKGEYKNVSQTTSSVPYLITILSILLTSIVAFSYARQTTVQNTWWVLTYLLVTIGIGTGLIAQLTFANSGAISRMNWLSYTVMTNLVMALLLYGLSRYLGQWFFYLYGFIVGFYLMLTPILGFSIQSGTSLAFFYRISPFQNMENGFTTLLKSHLGMGTIIVLVCLLIMAFSVNVVMILSVRKGVEHAENAA